MKFTNYRIGEVKQDGPYTKTVVYADCDDGRTAYKTVASGPLSPVADPVAKAKEYFDGLAGG